MIGTNTLKAKLRNGEGVIGAFNSIPSPDAVEILGFLGMDFVIIDAEHGVSDLESCEHQVRAAESVGISTMCRIALNLPQNILRYLDTGVMGAQIPQVNSAAEARATVDAVRYPPVGKRGLAGVRAGGYGIGMPLGDYVKLANEELILCVQIETTQAVEQAAEIVATRGRRPGLHRPDGPVHLDGLPRAADAPRCDGGHRARGGGRRRRWEVGRHHRSRRRRLRALAQRGLPVPGDGHARLPGPGGPSVHRELPRAGEGRGVGISTATGVRSP